jgi:hypothetical protein
MTRKTILHGLLCLVLALVIGLVTQSAVAQPTPEGKHKKRITTGTPKAKGVNKFKVKVKWISDGGQKQQVTAEANINGPDQAQPDNATTKAEKIAAAIQGAINALPPAARGVRADQGEAGGMPMPEVIIRNLAGNKLRGVKITRDDTNEREKIDPLAASFRTANMNSAIDIYGVPTDGTVEVTIGEGTPILVQTLGKTSALIEEEIVGELNYMGIDAFISTSPLLPDSDLIDPENPFDSSEIQLLSLDAPSFTVDMGDSGLGVAYEIEFVEAVPTLTEWGLIIFGVVLLGFITWVFLRRRKAVVSLR